jgi:hypothetical protein
MLRAADQSRDPYKALPNTFRTHQGVTRRSPAVLGGLRCPTCQKCRVTTGHVAAGYLS